MASFDPFEKEFGRRARSLRRTPAADSWARVERRMDGRRSRGATIFGLRPWMIAALVLLVAGVSIISKVSADRNNPLAKRAEFMEELSAPYTPDKTFVPEDYLPSPGEEDTIERDPDFRDVEVARKYRVHG